jgi:hypothetical protein
MLGSLIHLVLGFLLGTCALLYKLLIVGLGGEFMFSSAQLTQLITWIGIWLLFISSCWLFGGALWCLIAICYNLVTYMTGQGLVIKMAKTAVQDQPTPKETLTSVGAEIDRQQPAEKRERMKRVRSRWRGSV